MSQTIWLGAATLTYPQAGGHLRVYRICCLTLCLVLVTATLTAAQRLPRLVPIPPDKPFTFVVLGDNLGDDSGQPSAAFHQILRAASEASPAFAVNTGDMIYGRTTYEAVTHEHWRLYCAAIAPFKAPMFYIPGNHDIWSEASARDYEEILGPSHYAFDYGRARLIALDCEADSSRLGKKQLEWLRQQLAEAGQRIVLVFLPRPLFPVNGAIGTSMDAYPAERDQLHQLFVKRQHAIKGVFLGHEHLYHFHESDGVPYYITGGGGANLYVAPELGGFHHFLLVRGNPEKVTVELRKVGAPLTTSRKPRHVSPGELNGSFSLTAGADGAQKHEAPPGHGRLCPERTARRGFGRSAPESKGSGIRGSTDISQARLEQGENPTGQSLAATGNPCSRRAGGMDAVIAQHDIAGLDRLRQPARGGEVSV